jgi:hypothetical protein
VDDERQTAARLKLAKGFFGTIRLVVEGSEYEVRNALSRCYYAFFHLCHAALGRYWGHRLVAKKIENLDASFGELVTTLQTLRIEADYIPDVVNKEYGGELGAYRLRASQVIAQSQIQFERMLKLSERKLRAKKAQ